MLQPCLRALFGAFTGEARAKLNICRSVTVALPLAASWNYHMVKRWEETFNKDGVFFSSRFSPDLEEQLKVHQTHEYLKQTTGLLLHAAFPVGV